MSVAPRLASRAASGERMIFNLRSHETPSPKPYTSLMLTCRSPVHVLVIGRRNPETQHPNAWCRPVPTLIPHLRTLITIPHLTTLITREREFFIDNLLVRIHLIIEMIIVDRSCAMGACICFFRQPYIYLPHHQTPTGRPQRR